jgi:ribosome-binding ATPase YchF (GTP1/OBG family)
MAHAFSIQSLQTSTSLSISSLTSRKQFFPIFIGSSILISIVILTIILCFIDRLHKTTKQKKSSKKSNGILNHNSYNLTNGKRIASSSPIKTRYCYEDESPTHNYTSLKTLKPVIIVAPSISQSSSSVDSTTRHNTAQNRALNSTYSYTAIGTNDELMPLDFDDNNEDINSGIELMMTTV